MWRAQNIYSQVGSINTSQLEVCFGFYRLFMKMKFDVYLLCPFNKNLIYSLETGVYGFQQNFCCVPTGA